MKLPSPTTLLSNMATNLQNYLTKRGITNPAYVGIRTGGVWVAQALLEAMDKQDETLGILDVSFYRDDFTQKGLNPQVSPSALPFEIDNQHIVLIDDVLMSGRTIRAAMNELYDYGRPASITLVCLLDLDARELPIRPDVVGEVLDLGTNQRVKVQGPSPLTLELKTLVS
ncbi:bifunctional pyr operon transcriptional regulator/uracil phosphoribosyltransferase PyrR [Entomomonas asaccharolytica]|uniref:Bifunctional pyr operon transcriptional regulator/uracil phosphoribosyltransferase PyrR n=1 Tax=Entomomonas asaccharolytica TaxID=2785331 RepID=A0A974RVR7_9GAMM|nr:bifunctional pyr operon transcriptional regulator/uracil phosphoribosyltransferase PyrR [Entomomonas asaccharolytica]QQP84380.1 bifunctional pyr operon transcriptional regulator/uracil phosphoribosyltransferase PyrR [Entomomonas asaccharolytica]